MKCLMFCFLMMMVFVSLFSVTESKLREIKQKNPSNLNTDKVIANESNSVLNANKINTNNKVSTENSNKVESKHLKANTKHKVVSALNSDAKDKAQKKNINKTTPIKIDQTSVVNNPTKQTDDSKLNKHKSSSKEPTPAPVPKNANRAETKNAKVNQSDKSHSTGGTSGAAALAKSLMPELMSEDEEHTEHDDHPAVSTPSPTHSTSSKHDKASSSKTHSTSTHKNHNHSNHTHTTHNNHTKYNNHTHITHSNHTKYSNHTNKNHSKTSHSTKTNSTKTTKNSALIKKSTPPTKTPTENNVAPAAPEIQYEPVEYVTQISPQGKAALLYNKDASYATIDAPGFETPTFVSNIVNTKPVGVTIPRPIVHVIGTDVDPGFWQNVELNRYGNKAIEAHQFITPASYHINEQPIRFLSIENPDDLDVFDEIDENLED